jgi:hypothetical protein
MTAEHSSLLHEAKYITTVGAGSDRKPIGLPPLIWIVLFENNQFTVTCCYRNLDVCFQFKKNPQSPKFDFGGYRCDNSVYMEKGSFLILHRNITGEFITLTEYTLEPGDRIPTMGIQTFLRRI